MDRLRSTGRALPATAAAALLVALGTGSSAHAQAPAEPAPPPLPAATCDAGRALLDAGLPEQAIVVYTEVLRRRPGAPCPRKDVKEAQAALAPADPCVAGDALRAADADDSARETYQAALKADPSLDCAKTGLEALDDPEDVPEHVGDWFDELKRWWWLVPLAALALLLLAQFYWPRWLMIRLPFAGRFLEPRMRLQDIDDAGLDPPIAKGVTALVRDSLTRLSAGGDQASRYRLNSSSGREGLGAAVKEVEALAPQAQAVGAVVRLAGLLFPRARLTAVGTLQGRGDRGAGVTLFVEGAHGTPITTLWTGSQPPPAEGEDDDTAERYQSLAVPAAAWIDFEVRAMLGEKLPTVTPSARSYALLQGAIERAGSGDADGAVRFYEAAIAEDGSNAAALLNLGNLRARNDEEWDAALELLRRALLAVRTRR
jgi:tetratricopeptide (TPR) repeat protein